MIRLGGRYQITQNSGRKIWKAAIKDINGKPRTKNFTKLSEAEDWVADQRRARELGENTGATNPKMTVAEFLVGRLEAHKLNVKQTTYQSYNSVINNQINPVIGHINTSSLKTKPVEIFLDCLVAKGLDAGTITLAHGVLSVAYNMAKKSKIYSCPYINR